MLGRVWGMKQTTDLDKPIQYYLWVIECRNSKEALDDDRHVDNIKKRCIIDIS